MPLYNPSTAGSGTPAGSSGQVQYNNGGAFGGASLLYWDGTNSRLGVGTLSPQYTLDVLGSFNVKDANTPTKSYRFRTSGSNLDIDFSGTDAFLSTFSGADYTGTQRFKIRFEKDIEGGKFIGPWNFTDGPFGATTHYINPTGETVFNEAGANIDWRVEGDTITNVIAVDASEDAVIFGAGQKVQRTAVANVAYTALLTDYIIAYTSLTATRTVSLPAAATAGANRIYVIKDESGAAASFPIVIDPSGAETIDGATTKSISVNYGSYSIYTNGTAWFTY